MTKSTAKKAEAPSTEELQRQIEALRQDLLRITDTLAKMGKERIEEAAGEAKEKIAERIPEEQLRQIEALKAQGEEALEALKRQQKEHPIGTLLVAAGVGFLLGKALGGR
jgi:ElaB/YqjD/DUF883 family membrane-anchored ribosome-binding protein